MPPCANTSGGRDGCSDGCGDGRVGAGDAGDACVLGGRMPVITRGSVDACGGGDPWSRCGNTPNGRVDRTCADDGLSGLGRPSAGAGGAGDASDAGAASAASGDRIALFC